MLGDFVVLGGQVGVANHVTIGEGAQIAATSSVTWRRPARRALGRHAGEAGQLWFREMKTLERLAARQRRVRSPATGAAMKAEAMS